MKKTVRKWFWAWQEDKEKAFLEEMASKGLKLVKVFFGGYEFEEGEPEDIIYQFDFRGIDRMKEEEYLQLYEDGGWSFTSRFGRWYYFARESTADEQAPSLFNDNESQRAKYRRLLLFLLIVGVPIYFQLIIMFPNMPDSEFEFPGFYFFARVAILILAGLHIFAIVKIAKVYRKMRSYIRE